MEARLHVPDVLRHVGLDAALTGLQRLAEAELEQAGEWPFLYDTNVRYVREPRGQERWLPPSEVLRRGHGDCEDLAAYRSAELVLTGEDPDAQARVVRTGPRTWHAVVLRGDGSWEDPSAELGMRLAAGIAAPVRFALNPAGKRDYAARVDLSGFGYVDTLACCGPSPALALDGALALAQESELGGLGFVAPFLDIARSAAQMAMPQPPNVRVAPGGRIAVTPPAADAFQASTYEDGIINLARQLASIASAEVSRRSAQQQRKLTEALRR